MSIYECMELGFVVFIGSTMIYMLSRKLFQLIYDTKKENNDADSD